MRPFAMIAFASNRGLPGGEDCGRGTDRGALKQAWAWETNLSGGVCPLPSNLLALAAREPPVSLR